MKMKKKLKEAFSDIGRWKKRQLFATKMNLINEEMTKLKTPAGIKIIEADVLENETFLINYDIYSLTITALMTGALSPDIESRSVKASVLVFVL